MTRLASITGKIREGQDIPLVLFMPSPLDNALVPGDVDTIAIRIYNRTVDADLDIFTSPTDDPDDTSDIENPVVEDGWCGDVMPDGRNYLYIVPWDDLDTAPEGGHQLRIMVEFDTSSWGPLTAQFDLDVIETTGA